jgi:hypothetical protein
MKTKLDFWAMRENLNFFFSGFKASQQEMTITNQFLTFAENRKFSIILKFRDLFYKKNEELIFFIS